MGSLAAVDDVKRVAGILPTDESRDEAIVAALRVASEIIRTRLGREFSGGGSLVRTFRRVRAGSVIRLPDDAVSITSVTADGVSQAWTLDSPSRLRLYPADEFFGLVVYDQVVVAYQASTAPLNPLVIEATAHIAADVVAPPPASLAGRSVKGASIGGFSYQLDAAVAAGSEHAATARDLLNVLVPPIRVAVV